MWTIRSTNVVSDLEEIVADRGGARAREEFQERGDRVRLLPATLPSGRANPKTLTSERADSKTLTSERAFSRTLTSERLVSL